MRSRTSFFNRTVFLHDLKRFWPLTAGYALLWLLILPLERFTELSHHRVSNVFSAQYEALEIAVTGGYIIAFFFGILFAMAAFSYLTSPRATNGLHALPARRETLYLTHYLAGLCAQLAPQALTVLLTAAVLGANGCGGARVTGLLFAMCLPTVFFYSFGVLCMAVAGQALAAPVFYGVWSFLAVAVEYLVYSFAGNFLYGWSDRFSARLKYLSPVSLLLSGDAPRAKRLNDYALLPDGSREAIPCGVTIEHWQLLPIYAAVGLVLAALGLLLYRTRPSEATGSTVAIGWIRPIFKYGVAVCAALALGQLAYYVFFGQYRANGDYTLAGALLCMAAAGLVGYFAAEMLLKKSFRVWRSGRRGALCLTALLLAFGWAVSLDPQGYERYVPDEAEIESAQASLYLHYSDARANVTLTDAEQIRLAVAAHRALVADKARQQQNAGMWYDSEKDGVGCGSFSVAYALRDGRVVRREYRFVIEESELSDPASPAAALTAFYNDPAVTLSRLLDRDPRALDDLRITGGYCHTERRDDSGELRDGTDRELSAAEAQAFYDAVARDAAAGRAARSLFDRSYDDAREYTNITLYATYLPRNAPSGVTEETREPDGRASMEFYVQPTAGMTETLALLAALTGGEA